MQFHYAENTMAFTSSSRSVVARTGMSTDLTCSAGAEIEGVVERYAELTGMIELPPLWALGYHQSANREYNKDTTSTERPINVT